MIDLSFMAGTSVSVLGLGRSGLAVARALVGSGAKVSAWDDAPARRDDAKAHGIPLADLAAHNWSNGDVLVLSPGIAHTHPTPHPVAAQARAAGCPIIGDVELLAQATADTPKIGITGTNGKSTTTALIGHILVHAGIPCEVGGNLGPPVAQFNDPGRDGVIVLEMSSYQLELSETLTFDVAVHLNLTPDHLDRHGGMDGYVSAKRRMFWPLPARPQTAVVGIDDAHSREIYNDLVAARDRTVIPICATQKVAGGVYVCDGVLVDDRAGAATEIMDLSSVTTLRGSHNHQNAAAAFAAVTSGAWGGFAITAHTTAAAIASFPGLAHRQEHIADIADVTFINDSKATNPDAAVRALGSYGNIYWIAGGQIKDGGLGKLTETLGAVRHAFLIGEAKGLFATALDGHVSFDRCDTLVVAVQSAFDMARSSGFGGTVLLAPACASFDQFANFEARGDAFRACVNRLKLGLEGAA